jgi:hypothetical protein
MEIVHDAVGQKSPEIPRKGQSLGLETQYPGIGSIGITVTDSYSSVKGKKEK